MARASSEFLLAWNALSGGIGVDGWQTISVSAAGKCPVSAGRRSPNGEEALLVGFPGAIIPTGERLPDGNGFGVQRFDLFRDGMVWLALTRKLAGTADLFLAMVCDVVGVLDDSTQNNKIPPYQQFLTRVRAWMEFMRTPREPLTPEAVLGLVGELDVLATMLLAGIGPATAVDSWKGPVDAAQDFQLGSGAFEVKSTLAMAGFPAKIGSLEQLDDSVLKPLFLIGLRFQLADDGASLPDMVARVAQLLRGDPEAERRYVELLMAAGYLDMHADRYERRFRKNELRAMLVEANFPRLILGNVPPGVLKATYEIDLDRVAGQRVDLVEAMQMLGVK
jgi:hypothetical protein